MARDIFASQGEVAALIVRIGLLGVFVFATANLRSWWSNDNGEFGPNTIVIDPEQAAAGDNPVVPTPSATPGTLFSQAS